MRSFDILEILFKEFAVGDVRNEFRFNMGDTKVARFSYSPCPDAEIVLREDYPTIRLDIFLKWKYNTRSNVIQIMYSPPQAIILTTPLRYITERPFDHFISRCQELYRSCEDYDPEWRKVTQ